MARIAVKVRMEGDKALVKRLEKLASDRGIRKEARAALLEVGDMGVAIMVPLTPRKTGRLQNSETAKAMVSAKKEDLRVTLIAGGPSAPYAARVHETHKTQSRYMARALEALRPKAAPLLAERIDMRRAAL